MYMAHWITPQASTPSPYIEKLYARSSWPTPAAAHAAGSAVHCEHSPTRIVLLYFVLAPPYEHMAGFIARSWLSFESTLESPVWEATCQPSSVFLQRASSSPAFCFVSFPAGPLAPYSYRYRHLLRETQSVTRIYTEQPLPNGRF